MKKLLYALLLISLFGCGKDYYLRRSAVNYRKAIFHGYKPSIDSVPRVSTKSIKIYQQRPELALKIATFTDSVHTTDTVYMQNILTEYIEKELQGYCDLDTLFQLPDGSELSVRIDGGLLNIDLKTFQKEEKVYVPEKKGSLYKAIGFSLLALLIIYLLIRGAVFLGNPFK